MRVTVQMESMEPAARQPYPPTHPGREVAWRVRVELQAVRVADPMAAPHGVALVLDHSPYVPPAQLEAAVAGVVRGTEALGAQDYLALVLMDGQHRLLASPAQVGGSRQWVADRLAEVRPGAGANLCGAWLRARQQLEEAPWVTREHAASTRRIVLCTAGHVDTGIADAATLAELARGARHRGIGTSVLALGERPALSLLEGIALAGGGRCHRVETPQEVAEALAAERRELGLRAMRGVTVRVVPSDGVRLEVEHPGGIREPGGIPQFTIPELASEQLVAFTLRASCLGAQWDRLRGAQAPLAVVQANGERFTARGGTDCTSEVVPVHPSA